MRRREVLVTQYTSAAWRSQVAWHAYWWPRGHHTLDEDLRAGSPPAPRNDHTKVRLTWGQIRKWVAEDAAAAPRSRDASRRPGGRGSVEGSLGLRSADRHRLDRAAAELRRRYAVRPARRQLGQPKWLWSDRDAEECEHVVREVLADAARHQSRASLERRATAALARAAAILPLAADPPTSAPADGPGCEHCHKPLPPGLRPEALYCDKRCRQAASRARLKASPRRAPDAPRERCEWCSDPLPPGLRPEAMFCGKRCRQASSRFALAVKRGLAPPRQRTLGPDDLSRPAAAPSTPATRRRSSPPAAPAQGKAFAPGGLRLAYADPPYPGRAGYYAEREEVDHRELLDRLLAEFPDGWALSTRAGALRDVLAMCPPEVRVCSWHRHVRHTPSRRPLSAWEPLIVHGGRELPTTVSQTVTDALTYGGRFRTFPNAVIGMKPPQFSVWMFTQLGARAGDELHDLYPGSGAVTAAWRRFTTEQLSDDTSPRSPRRRTRRVERLAPIPEQLQLVNAAPRP